jgi:hypothetical protein
MSTSVATLHSSMTVRRALEWQRAWADSELGYEPTEEDLELLEDARRRPEYYMSDGPKRSTRRRSHKPRRSRDDRPYRLPFTIV